MSDPPTCHDRTNSRVHEDVHTCTSNGGIRQEIMRHDVVLLDVRAWLSEAAVRVRKFS